MVGPRLYRGITSSRDLIKYIICEYFTLSLTYVAKDEANLYLFTDKNLLGNCLLLDLKNYVHRCGVVDNDNTI